MNPIAPGFCTPHFCTHVRTHLRTPGDTLLFSFVFSLEGNAASHNRVTHSHSDLGSECPTCPAAALGKTPDVSIRSLKRQANLYILGLWIRLCYQIYPLLSLGGGGSLAHGAYRVSPPHTGAPHCLEVAI
jgi:hypothetical protein